MASEDLQIELGQRKYTLEPQPYAYLRQQLKKFVAGLSGIDFDGSDIMGVIGENAYGLLRVLIPNMMEQWEFEGYSSSTARELDAVSDFDGGPDKPINSPSVPQIFDAIERAAKVNRLDIVKHLRGLVGGDFLGVLARKAMIEAVNSLSSPTNESLSSAPSTDSDPSISTPGVPASPEPSGSEDTSPASGMSYETIPAPPPS
jgi:hypothetical protein